MSNSQAQLHEQTQRIQSFRNLLDPTDLLPGHNVADVYSLRHLCLQSGGIPDTSTSSNDGWLRAQAWRVLLSYLSPEKSEWSSTLKKRRAEYYQFVADFLPQEELVNQPSSSSSSLNPAQASLPGNLSERDALLDQIFRDLARSRKNAFAFYRQEIRPSYDCPLAPPPRLKEGEASPRISKPKLKSRHALLRKLEKINGDYAQAIQQERQLNTKTSSLEKSSQNSQPMTLSISPTTPIREDVGGKPFITLQPASPAQEVEPLQGDDVLNTPPRNAKQSGVESPESVYIDRHWHSLLRILYIYALLNPSMGYVQGMNEVLFILLYVLGTSSGLPSSLTNDHDEDGEQNPASASNGRTGSQGEIGEHAEADAFWCFSALIGEVRDLYDFDGVDHASARLQVSNRRQQPETTSRGEAAGMGSLLHRFSLRLRWLDEELWKTLRKHSLDPRLPYYSFRWLACLLSTELSLPSIVRVWDAFLAESSESGGADSDNTSPKVDFLIDISCSLLINVRGLLLDAVDSNEEEDSFSNAIDVLQNYPDEDIGPILEMACLYRQRRLAAPLTGDGPPTQDEEDQNSTLRGKAMNALKEWRSASATYSSTPRRVSENLINSSGTPSSSSPAARLQKYADAIQKSDAAASISKASTNWQAKAMATWSATKSAQSTPTREGRLGSDVGNSSLSEMGSNWFQRLRTGSESYTSPDSSKQHNETHPSLRWSTVPPHLPIPNVLDSPPERQEYGYGNKTHSGFISVNRLAAANALTEAGTREHKDISPNSVLGSSKSSPGSRSSFDGVNDETSSQNNSPANTSFSRFAHLPSLQHAAAVSGIRGSPKSISRQQQSHSSPHNHHGLQPLMLSNAARPAREHSSSGSVNGDEPASRKVASGPMAANVSPRGSAFASRRRADNQSYGGSGSYRDSAFTTMSFSSSAFRSGDHTGSLASSQAGDSPLPDSHGSESWSHLNRSSAGEDHIPPLPIQDYKRPSIEGLPSNSSANNGPAFSLASGRSTVNASAFGRYNAGTRSSAEGNNGEDGPVFGHVSSSADVPLTSKSTLQRKTRARQGSASTSIEVSSSNVPVSFETEESSAKSTGATNNIIITSEASVLSPTSPSTSSAKQFSTQTTRPLGPRQSKTRESMGYFENPRSAPVPPPPENEGNSSTASSIIEKTSSNENEADDEQYPMENDVRKYSLTDDGPSMGAANTANINRQSSSSSAKRISGGGIARNRRAFSGKREPVSKRRGSNRESQQSVLSASDSLQKRLNRESFSKEVFDESSVANLSIVESGTSLTPSPGPEVGKMFRAEELIQMLEQNAEQEDNLGNPARISRKSDHLSIHGFDQPEFVSAEDIRQEDLEGVQRTGSSATVKSNRKEQSSNYDPTLLGPRSKRPISMPSDVEDSENDFEHGGESGGEIEEWHETNIESRTPDVVDPTTNTSTYGSQHNYV